MGSVFHVAPTPQVNPCPPSAALVVRVSGLRLSNIIAGDVDGSSDAYCLFLTNPPNLFGPKTTPSTTIKCGPPRRADRPAHTHLDPHPTPPTTPPRRYHCDAVEFDKRHRQSMAEAGVESGTPTRKARGSIFSSIRTSVLPRGSLMPTTIMATMMGPEEKAEWTDAETPLLRPRVRTKEELENVNLIVAVHDYDTGRFDDLLGTILVPIGAAAAAKAGHAVRTVGDDEYEVTLNEAPLVLGNARFVGEISCVLHVSGGAAIRPALARAAQAGCGARATTAEFRRSWMLRMWAKVVKALASAGARSPPCPRVATTRASRRPPAPRTRCRRRWRRRDRASAWARSTSAA